MRVDHLRSIHRPQFSGGRARLRPHVGHALAVAAFVGLLSIGQAMAQRVGEDAAEASTTPVAGKNGKICQREEVTGSRMPKRVCLTPEQWAARERAAKDMVRELDRKSPGGPREDGSTGRVSPTGPEVGG